jgi:4-hydroxy-2-oxoheptanedioate aldolase
VDLLVGDRSVVGTYTLSASPAVLEAVALAGFDYVIVDCEHSATSPYGGELEALLRAVAIGGSAGLVRVLDNDHGQIGRALDAGAGGVIVPHIRNAQAMSSAVSAAHRPPLGNRGSAPMVRAAGYGTTPWRDVVATSSSVVGPLIEDPEAVDRIEEILDVAGVGALWFGAFDLAVSLGLPNPGARDVIVDQLRATVYAAAESRSIPVFDHAWDEQEAARLLGLGARGVSVSTDLTLLVAGMVRLRESLLDVAPGSWPPVGHPLNSVDSDAIPMQSY